MVSYLEGRTTRDGRKRAPTLLFGANYRRGFPWIRALLAIGVVGAGVWAAYQRHSYVSPQDQFLHKVSVRPYGVLGTTITLQGSLKREAPEPDEATAVVDPAELMVVYNTTAKATGTSGAIYNWLGLRGVFPNDVVLALGKMSDAKHHDYKDKHVIHVVSPDLREGVWSEREAAIELSRAYRNIIHEFVVSECDTLRVPPISDGTLSGDLFNQMPPITHEAFKMAFEQLHIFDKEYVLRPDKKIDLCVFMNRDWDRYNTVFKVL